MKLLTIAVPCYNSQDYMKNCIETLLSGGDDVEILIVDDGSQDDTAVIADNFAESYPCIVRVIHQPNGGHGDAVMTGLKNARGLYFKVVDSDDWLDKEAYHRVLETLRSLSIQNEPVDLLISNYAYDKVGVKKKRVISYENALPPNRILTWEDIGHFRIGQYILMHATIYRTGLLKECELHLPRHTFYVDNLYVYIPMRSVKTIYYLNVDLYHYFIGRNDQSVNEQVMIKQIDQQLLVNRLMFESVDLTEIQQLHQRAYMQNYLEIVTVVTSILLVKSGTPENAAKKELLWADLARQWPEVYRHLRYRPLGQMLHLPGTLGRRIMITWYHISQRIFGFN